MALTDRLHARAQEHGLRLGPSQEAALLALGALPHADVDVDGVYRHGPAGRGKTWLLDASTSCRSTTPTTQAS